MTIYVLSTILPLIIAYPQLPSFILPGRENYFRLNSALSRYITHHYNLRLMMKSFHLSPTIERQIFHWKMKVPRQKVISFLSRYYSCCYPKDRKIEGLLWSLEVEYVPLPGKLIEWIFYDMDEWIRTKLGETRNQ